MLTLMYRRPGGCRCPHGYPQDTLGVLVSVVEDGHIGAIPERGRCELPAKHALGRSVYVYVCREAKAPQAREIGDDQCATIRLRMLQGVGEGVLSRGAGKLA